MEFKDNICKTQFSQITRTCNHRNYKQYADIHTKQKVYFPTLGSI